MAVSSYMFSQPLASIREIQDKSSAPFISANLFESETGNPVFDAFTLVSADDLNIAIVGMTSIDGEEKNRKHLSGIDLVKPSGSHSASFINSLERQSDIIILATHSGLSPKTSTNLQAMQFDGVDLIVGQHQNGKNILNCHEWLTRIDLEFVNGELNVTSYEQIKAPDQSTCSLFVTSCFSLHFFPR